MSGRNTERLFELAGGPALPIRERKACDSYDQRFGRILGAAAEEIARSGFHRASMRQIAGASGVSLAGLYHYFENKEHLLFLIQFRAFSALLVDAQSNLSGEDDAGEQLRTLVRTHVSHVVRSMATLKVCSHELDSLGGESYERVRRVRREYYELARSVVERLIDQVAPDSGLDARVATMSLFGMLNWLYRWYDPQRDRSPMNVANQIYSHFVAGLTGLPRNGRSGGHRNGVKPRSGPVRGVGTRQPGTRKGATRASPRTRALRAG